MRNYYDILGIGRDATQSQIKAAYRKLAKKYHPDSAGSQEDKERFQEVQEAYAVLSDPEKRKMYHYYGHEAYRKSYHAQHATHADPEAEGAAARDGHCGACEQGRTQTEDETPPPAAVRIAVWLELSETLKAVEKEVYYVERIPNPDTSSRVKHIEKTWKFKVKLPSGCYEKQFFILDDVISENKEFAEHLREAYPDKLFVVIVLLRDKPGFLRQGYHLYTDFTVDYHTLVLGGTVKIPSLQGEILYEIPAGAVPEHKLRLVSQGLIRPKKMGGRGDLYVTLHVRIPQELTIPQLSAMLKLREALEATGDDLA
jgi:DnaJ-class molecular chaperone